MQGTYTKFIVSGRNLELFIAKLNRNKINLYNLVKKSEKELFFSVEFNDEKKIFAIFQGSCYNIKKLRNYGKTYPLLFLKKNIGVLLGLIFFLSIILLENQLVYKIKFDDEGSCFYKTEITEILKTNNFDKYAVAKKLNFKKISSEIMRLKGVTFATIKRKGNYLIVNTIIDEEMNTSYQKKYKPIISDVAGEIVYISVISGTSAVKLGDIIDSGKILVYDYYIDRDDKEVKTFVIAKINIKTTKTFFYESDTFDDSDKIKAQANAMLKLYNEQILGTQFEFVNVDGKNYIKVDIKYIKQITEV